jgi:hypothetical protein
VCSAIAPIRFQPSWWSTKKPPCGPDLGDQVAPPSFVVKTPPDPDAIPFCESKNWKRPTAKGSATSFHVLPPSVVFDAVEDPEPAKQVVTVAQSTLRGLPTIPVPGVHVTPPSTV